VFHALTLFIYLGPYEVAAIYTSSSNTHILLLLSILNLFQLIFYMHFFISYPMYSSSLTQYLIMVYQLSNNSPYTLVCFMLW